MTRGVGDPTYDTFDPVWDDGDPVEPGYPAGYRAVIQLLASPTYFPSTVYLLLQCNEEFANSPVAVGRRSATTGQWEMSGPTEKVALLDYIGDSLFTFVSGASNPYVFHPPNSTKLYGHKLEHSSVADSTNSWWVEWDDDYPFDFVQRSESPDETGRSDIEISISHSVSSNADGSMLAAMHGGFVLNVSQFSLWEPTSNTVEYFRTDDAGFSGVWNAARRPRNLIIDGNDHLWMVMGNVTRDSTDALKLYEFSWSVGGGNITLTHLNTYDLNIQVSGANTWSYTINGMTYNEATDTIVFHWFCNSPSWINTPQNPTPDVTVTNITESNNCPPHFRITHFDLATRTKKFSTADSVRLRDEDDVFLSYFDSIANQIGRGSPLNEAASGASGFLGTSMNYDGDRTFGLWTQQDWTVYQSSDNNAQGDTGSANGFWWVDTTTGIAELWGPDIWPDFLDPDRPLSNPPGNPGVQLFGGSIYIPTTEKFWAARRGDFGEGFFGPEPEELFIAVTQGFGIYGWDEDPCPPCEEDTEPCGTTPEPACAGEWPFSELQPRSVGVEMVPATLGGGAHITSGQHPTNATPNGFWRIHYEGVPIHRREHVLLWREMETLCDGRSGVICVHVYDGKRAPWLTVGGALNITASGPLTAGSRSGAIKVTTGGTLQPGMLFSYNGRLYMLATVGVPSGSPPIYPVSFWPNIRAAIPADAALVFDHPTCLVHLMENDGMTLPLRLHQNASASVDFEED